MPAKLQSIGHLEAYAAPVSKVLEEFLDNAEVKVLFGSDELAQWAFSSICDFAVRPGKRLRGSLAAATYDEVCGQRFASDGLVLGAALELFHAYILLIDDVMDRSLERRGKPTLQVLYTQTNPPDTTAHEANMVAISLGLTVQHLSGQLLSRLKASPETIVSIRRSIDSNFIQTALGQCADLSQKVGRKVSRPDIIRKYEQKTGRYTFVNPLQCALTLAGAETDEAACAAIGLPAGVAFQLNNDLHDLFPEQTTQQKVIANDIREGVLTLVLYEALQRADKPTRTRITHMVQGHGCAYEDMIWFRKYISTSGVVADMQRQIQRSVDQACQAVRAASSSGLWSTPFADMLSECIRHYCLYDPTIISGKIKPSFR